MIIYNTWIQTVVLQTVRLDICENIRFKQTKWRHKCVTTQTKPLYHYITSNHCYLSFFLWSAYSSYQLDQTSCILLWHNHNLRVLSSNVKRRRVVVWCLSAGVIVPSSLTNQWCNPRGTLSAPAGTSVSLPVPEQAVTVGNTVISLQQQQQQQPRRKATFTFHIDGRGLKSGR